MKLTTETVEIGGKTIKFETGKYAKQASGAVVISCGDSSVMVTVVCATGGRDFDFLPLTVIIKTVMGQTAPFRVAI